MERFSPILPPQQKFCFSSGGMLQTWNMIRRQHELCKSPLLLGLSVTYAYHMLPPSPLGKMGVFLPPCK